MRLAAEGLGVQLRLVAALGGAGVPGVLRNDCVVGECAEDVAEWLAEPFPTQLPYVSVYSRRDWVVDWRACVDPLATPVEVTASHAGLAFDPRVIIEVVSALERHDQRS